MYLVFIFFDSIRFIHKNIRIKNTLKCTHLSNPKSSSKFIEGICCPGNEHNKTINSAHAIKYNFGCLETNLTINTTMFFNKTKVFTFISLN